MTELEDVIEAYNNIRKAYKEYCRNSEVRKEGLIEYESKFIEIKANLTRWKAKMTGEWTRYDDKAATAVKYRIAMKMYREGFTDINGDKYEKTSLSSSEKMAAGTEQYQKFIADRAFYKESFVNIADTKDDVNSYINLIKDQLK